MSVPNWKLQEIGAGTRWVSPAHGETVGDLFSSLPMTYGRRAELGRILAAHHPGAATNLILTGNDLLPEDYENIAEVFVGEIRGKK